MNTADVNELKSYLKRLSDGEDLKSVQKDFSERFENADPRDIMNAEQSMIKEGVPLEKVQKLCDIHSALFHRKPGEGAEAPGKKSSGGKAASEKGTPQTGKISEIQQKNAILRKERTQKLINIPGHPLNTFTKENRAIEALLSEAETCDPAGIANLLPKIRELSVHYAKKGDLIYPVLKVNYNISGPADVMWNADDEIKKELALLWDKFSRKGAEALDESWEKKARAVIKRAQEMIYKEDNILFQICAVQFSDEDWYRIYMDSQAYEECLGVKAENPEFEIKFKKSEVRSDEAFSGGKLSAEALSAEVSSAGTSSAGAYGPESAVRTVSADEIRLPGGHFTPEQLEALLNTIPMEISFVDENNINRFFNESDGPKLFKRPHMALDREVFSCHPPKVEPMVRGIIESFRSGEKDDVSVWMKKNGRDVCVRYMAVRDRNGRYLGTMEVVQDMEFAKNHFKSVL